MTTSKRGSLSDTRKITTIAILSAIATIIFLIIEIPIAAFYKLDFSNVPVLMAGFALGPVAGIITLVLKGVISIGLIRGDWVGLLADLIVGMAMVLPASLIYMKKKTRKGAVIGMIVGSLIAIAASVPANILLIELYHVPVEQVVAMGQGIFPAIKSELDFLLLITAPFNLLKWAAISIVGLLIYKPLSPVLHGRRQ